MCRVLVRPGPGVQHKYAGQGSNSCQRSDSRYFGAESPGFGSPRRNEGFGPRATTPLIQICSCSTPEVILLHSSIKLTSAHTSAFFTCSLHLPPSHPLPLRCPALFQLCFSSNHQPSSPYLSKSTSIWTCRDATLVDSRPQNFSSRDLFCIRLRRGSVPAVMLRALGGFNLQIWATTL